jgi:hypothetical protein
MLMEAVLGAVEIRRIRTRRARGRRRRTRRNDELLKKLRVRRERWGQGAGRQVSRPV